MVDLEGGRGDGGRQDVRQLGGDSLVLSGPVGIIFDDGDAHD